MNENNISYVTQIRNIGKNRNNWIESIFNNENNNNHKNNSKNNNNNNNKTELIYSRHYSPKEELKLDFILKERIKNIVHNINAEKEKEKNTNNNYINNNNYTKNVPKKNKNFVHFGNCEFSKYSFAVIEWNQTN